MSRKQVVNYRIKAAANQTEHTDVIFDILDGEVFGRHMQIKAVLTANDYWPAEAILNQVVFGQFKTT